MSDEMILTAVNRNPSVPLNGTLDAINSKLNTRLTVTRANNLDLIPSIGSGNNAIREEVGFRRQVFSSSGTWVRPVGVTHVKLTMCSQGGNGVGDILNRPSGASGATGIYVFGAVFPVSGNVTVNVSANGNTSFGSLTLARGLNSDSVPNTTRILASHQLFNNIIGYSITRGDSNFVVEGRTGTASSPRAPIPVFHRGDTFRAASMGLDIMGGNIVIVSNGSGSACNGAGGVGALNGVTTGGAPIVIVEW